MHRNPMVPDAGQRKRDVASFFAPETPAAERDRILQIYDVSYVLLDVTDTHDEVKRYLDSAGVVQGTSGDLQLIQVRRVAVKVPAFKVLGSGHDGFLQHRRRYTRRQIEAVIREAGPEPDCRASAPDRQMAPEDRCAAMRSGRFILYAAA